MSIERNGALQPELTLIQGQRLAVNVVIRLALNDGTLLCLRMELIDLLHGCVDLSLFGRHAPAEYHSGSRANHENEYLEHALTLLRSRRAACAARSPQPDSTDRTRAGRESGRAPGEPS